MRGNPFSNRFAYSILTVAGHIFEHSTSREMLSSTFLDETEIGVFSVSTDRRPRYESVSVATASTAAATPSPEITATRRRIAEFW